MAALREEEEEEEEQLWTRSMVAMGTGLDGTGMFSASILSSRGGGERRRRNDITSGKEEEQRGGDIMMLPQEVSGNVTEVGEWSAAS